MKTLNTTVANQESRALLPLAGTGLAFIILTALGVVGAAGVAMTMMM